MPREDGHGATLAAETERVAVHSPDSAAELGFITATPVRASAQSPWVYRIQQPFIQVHEGIESSHAGELYYAGRRGSFPTLRLDQPAAPNDVPQFLYATPGEYWAAQLQQERLAAEVSADRPAAQERP